MRAAKQNNVIELDFKSDVVYENPYIDIELDIVVTSSVGTEYTVPAFWVGGAFWRGRLAFGEVGEYKYRTVCSNISDNGLHGITGCIDVTFYDLENVLYKYGPIIVSDRHFIHRDGTPYLWLSDTWWMGLTNRLSFDNGDFQKLASDRKSKGFNTIFMVMGLYPDMEPFDEAGANEVGYPFLEKDYDKINPLFFELADVKIRYLIEVGLMPCLFGCWGYFSDFMSLDRLKRFWRYIIARYAAFPVAFSYAGESNMPFYNHPMFGNPEYAKKSFSDWSEISKYVKSIEPFGRIFSIHPQPVDFIGIRDGLVSDTDVLDYYMAQTFHGNLNSAPHIVKLIRDAGKSLPAKPVLNGEGYYEGILEQSREEVQRWFFWASVLSGGAGHCYGANGIWQLNEPNKPFRANPNNAHWGDTPWNEAMHLNGSKQVGLARKFLLKYNWNELIPHQDWIIHDDCAEGFEPYCAGIDKELRIIYFSFTHSPLVPLKAVRCLEQGIKYRGKYVNPSDYTEYTLGEIISDIDGVWVVPAAPIMRDWILVLEAIR